MLQNNFTIKRLIQFILLHENHNKASDGTMMTTRIRRKGIRKTKSLRVATWNVISFTKKDTEIILKIKEHNIDMLTCRNKKQGQRGHQNRQLYLYLQRKK